MINDKIPTEIEYLEASLRNKHAGELGTEGDADERNADSSTIEAYRFAQGHPEREGAASYFAYLSRDLSRLTTFTGQTLAYVTWIGKEYKMPAIGTCSTRRNFRARGIDGRMWTGTAFVSSGDYVRMRSVKEARRERERYSLRQVQADAVIESLA